MSRAGTRRAGGRCTHRNRATVQYPMRRARLSHSLRGGTFKSGMLPKVSSRTFLKSLGESFGSLSSGRTYASMASRTTCASVLCSRFLRASSFASWSFVKEICVRAAPISLKTYRTLQYATPNLRNGHALRDEWLCRTSLAQLVFLSRRSVVGRRPRCGREGARHGRARAHRHKRPVRRGALLERRDRGGHQADLGRGAAD